MGQALQELRQVMQACPYGTPDEALLLWYLRDRYYDVAEAKQKLTHMLKWRSEFR